MQEIKVRVALADSCLFSEHVVTGNTAYIFTDDGEMKDILEEAGVKSVSTSVQLCSFSVVWHMAAYVSNSLVPQKKMQKRKFQDGNFDEDMDTEPQLKYKGIANHAEIASVVIVG